MTTGTLAPANEENREALNKETAWSFDTTHRCDRCGAQAYMRAIAPKSEHDLLFCAHHGNKKLAGVSTIKTLEAKGWKIDDQSSRLYEHTKPDGGSAAG